MGSSTAYIYLADGSIVTIDACTYPSSKNYAIIPAGTYHATVGTHNGSSGSYTALLIGTVQLGYTNPNPAYSDGRTYATGINIHRPGKNNATGMTSSGNPISAGCITIDGNSWSDFIGYFDTPEQRSNTVGVTVSRGYPSPRNINQVAAFNAFQSGAWDKSGGSKYVIYY